MRQEEVFRALADPNRRQILKLLRSGSLSAGEIGAHFSITPGSLSHHFNVLKAADLVRAERQGQFVIYTLNTTVMEDVMTLMIDLFGGVPWSQTEDGGSPPPDSSSPPSPTPR